METPPDPAAPSDAAPGWRRWLVPVGIGLGYGLLFRLAFALEMFANLLGVMTTAFILVVPFAMGALTVLRVEPEPGWKSAAFAPWLPTLLMLIAALLLAWEGIICAVVWLPAALVAATVGGLVGKVVRGSGRPTAPLALVVAALPVVVAPVENQFPDPVRTRTVHDAIEIEADAETVWRQIREVPPIRPDELGGSFAYWLGFPRPIEATLEGEGVGAVRHATFEGGVAFVERVTEWEAGRSLAFTIDASAVPSTTFDQHVAVGGRYFDVLDGRYEIEPIGPGRVVLHLTSEQRLSTRFNAYTQLWTDRFMSDIQSTILEVVKARAEAG